LPEEAGNKKYDTAAVAMIALLKYGSGLPFNRLQGLQANLGVPLPSSTQWDIIERSADCFKPAYKKMIELAAQGEIFHNDDTTIKIQSLIQENKNDSPARKGMFTTGIVSVLDGRKIVLFFSGRKHAGENLGKVLSRRDTLLPTPLQMCDALSRNTPSEFNTILAYCLVHARRYFFDAAMNFPEECQFVIDTLADVYRFDEEAKEQSMTPDQRLQYHQKNSAKLMQELEVWLDEQIDQKMVEPNSSLGDAIYYMLKHWQNLTAFLRIPGAPLDNNICERALKKAILHRKNSLFFKSERGAAVGDMFMSLIYTCEQSGANPFDYLKALQDHAGQVEASPSEWMPWNFSTPPAKP
jgi:transposase